MKILKTSKTTLTAVNTLSNTGSLYIGDEDGVDNESEFMGYIDEVKIYRASLTSDQSKILSNSFIRLLKYR